MNLPQCPFSDQEVAAEVASIITQQLSDSEQQEALRFILSAIDLTTLNGSDNKAVIANLCAKVLQFSNKEKGVKNPAAVCVYSPFVAQAKELLKNQNVNVAAVAGAFPSGQSPLSVKVAEVEYAVAKGADEIDMVISRGTFLEGNFEEVGAEVAAIKKACGAAHLKVILETGELKNAENIWLASHIAMENGADFIKTSTGKISPAATLEALYVMLEAIKLYNKKSGKKIGMKPAGGISDVPTALDFYKVLRHVMGEEYLTPTLFRYGASRLADAVKKAII